MKIIARSLFCWRGVCQSCGSPDSRHSDVYVCQTEGEGLHRFLCGECLSQHDTSGIKARWSGMLLEPDHITAENIARMRSLHLTLYPNHWEKVRALGIAVPIMGGWYWIAGTDPNYWLNEQ